MLCCGSGIFILDLKSRMFIGRIRTFHFESWIQGQNGTGTRIRKSLEYIFPDPGFRILDPDPQHWKYHESNDYLCYEIFDSFFPFFYIYERLFFILFRDRRLEARTLGCTSTSRQAKDPQPGQHKNWTRPWNRPYRLQDDSCDDNLLFTFCVSSCR
jgi:hypothetical protein